MRALHLLHPPRQCLGQSLGKTLLYLITMAVAMVVKAVRRPVRRHAISTTFQVAELFFTFELPLGLDQIFELNEVRTAFLQRFLWMLKSQKATASAICN